ncbi:MAG TPA: ribonuclease R [Candidatus Cloacimonadota bacterium]|nr:ribonuclease R [Candidatus Cloacimonadota bacterium]HPT72570.1 ribonuclease R [Candidatus Cloacimonadota bacterium]
MDDKNNLRETILEFMKEKPGYGYTYKQITEQIRIPKHHARELRAELQAMIRDGLIHFKNKEYRLSSAKATTMKSEAQYITGKFDGTSLAKNYSYAFVITDSGDYFVSSEDTLNAYHDDIVRAEVKYSRQQKKYCIIREVIQRAREEFVGNIASYGNKYVFINDNRKITTNFDISDKEKAVIGQKVILKITNWGNRALNRVPIGKVIEVLGTAGNPEVEMLGIIKQFDLPLEFPDEVIQEANSLPQEISNEMISRRKDYRNLLTFTIDPISAKDYDDAISLEVLDNGYRLYVHIADVAHYVKPGSNLFKEALNRGNSYYFPKKVIPMLPEQVSNKLCSLRPDEEKLTMSVVTEFDSQGRVKWQEFHESVIKSNSRLNYEEVDKVFSHEKNDVPEDIQTILFDMLKLSSLLSDKRKKQGYLFFDLPETDYIYDEEGLIHKLDLSFETESHTLIENFMLIANEYVAVQLTQRAKTTMYRIHEFPDPDKLDKLADLSVYYGLSMIRRETVNKTIQEFLSSLPSEDYHKVFDKIVLRSMKKARYSTNHLPHFGLAMETYTHFTSPIRRLCDLVVHHQLKNYVAHSDKTEFSTRELEDMSVIASEKELIADQSEREVERFIIAEFMKKNLGDEFTGIVTGMNNSNVFIQLDQIPISGVLPTSSLKTNGYYFDDQYLRILSGNSESVFLQLVDRVKVQISQVTDDVYLSLIDVISEHSQIVTKIKNKNRNHKKNERPNSRKSFSKKGRPSKSRRSFSK